MIIKKFINKKYLLFVNLVLMLSTTPGFAKVTKVGTTMGQFLKIGIGARNVGMGGACVASVKDANALYWNPSVIAKYKRKRAVAGYTDWLLDTKLAYTNLVIPISRANAIGVSVNSLTMDKMDVRTLEFPDGTGETFTASDLAIGLSYARALTNYFSIGFSAKYIQESIWNCNATSIGFDFGTIYNTDNNRLLIGASVSNFGNKMQFTGKDLRIYYDQNPDETGDNEHIPAYYETSKWDLPLIFRVGCAINYPEFPIGKIVAEIDAIHPNDNTEKINLGIEWEMNNMIFLRAGYQSLFQQSSEKGFTCGAGLRYRIVNNYVNINYAYSDFGRLSYVQRIDMEFEL